MTLMRPANGLLKPVYSATPRRCFRLVQGFLLQAMEDLPSNPAVGSPFVDPERGGPQEEKRHLRLVVCRARRCLTQKAGSPADLLSVGAPVYVGSPNTFLVRYTSCSSCIVSASSLVDTVSRC